MAGRAGAVAAAGRRTGKDFQCLRVELLQDFLIVRVAAADDDLVIRGHAGKAVHAGCAHDLLDDGALHKGQGVPVQVQVFDSCPS